MVSNQRHELHLLSGSYALDALPDDEQADFEKHLARCPSCADEVRGLRETAARMAMATGVTAPPGMHAPVLAAIPRTRQLPPPGRNLLARAGQRTGPWRMPLSRAGLTAGVLALAAAVAFLLVTQFATNSQLEQAQDANRSIAAVLSAPDARIESLRQPWAAPSRPSCPRTSMRPSSRRLTCLIRPAPGSTSSGS